MDSSVYIDRGMSDEWHLDSCNAFSHIAFDLGAGLCHPVIVIASQLFHARLVTIGSVGNSMGGDGIEQVLVDSETICRVMSGPKLNQWLKGF